MLRQFSRGFVNFAQMSGKSAARPTVVAPRARPSVYWKGAESHSEVHKASNSTGTFQPVITKPSVPFIHLSESHSAAPLRAPL